MKQLFCSKQTLAFFTLLVTLSLPLSTDAQNYAWAAAMGSSTGVDEGRAIAVDGSGNVYTTGYFQGTVDFDPGTGTANLTSAGVGDIFISKLDASGNYVWAKRMGAASDDRGYGIAVDGSGNVYTTGYFIGTVDFDPGAGTANLTVAGVDIFISKLDASGNYVWAKNIGGTSTDIAFAITVDGSGNVYTTGSFEGTADFDPDAGTANLISAGFQDVFISKLDASGNYIWAKRMGGATSSDIGYGIAVDGSGNVHTTGIFNGTVDFDPNAGTANLISAGTVDIFISKLNASGNYVWAKRIGAGSDDRGFGIAVDGSSNVYTTGIFEETVDFDPNAGTANRTSMGLPDIFISKLSSSVLGVELFSFSGKNTEGGNLLTWQTTSEVNNKGFEVERQQATGNSWETIGFVAGKGKASSYEFTDKDPFNTSYYRLRKIDDDGKANFSKVISIERNAATQSDLRVYPNPAHNSLTIDYAVDGQKEMRYTVVNLLGQILLQGNSTGRNLDISTLPTGAFIFKIGKEQAKFFKQ